MKAKHFVTFLVIVFLMNPITSLMAQELDSLKAEVKSLQEQLKKVDQLESRIAEIENDSSNAKFRSAREITVDTSGTKLLQIPDSDLRETHKSLTGDDLINDDFIGSWPMFGTNLRLKVGGYVKADFVYDGNGTLDKTQFLMSTIPVEGTPEYANGGYVYFFSRETRFSLDVRRIETGAIPVRMFIEADFWSTGNLFRLRHAYIAAGDFLVGQTWTTLSVLQSLPFMIDFAAGDALFGGRTTQIRYQTNLSDEWQLAIGLENLDYSGIENPDTLGGAPSPLLPLLAVKLQYTWESGLGVLGSSIAQLRWDGADVGPDAEALQWDAVFAGRQYLGKENFFTWNISYGIGSGENIMAFAQSQANAVLTSDGKLQTMPAFAFVLGFVHKWNDELTSNFSYAYGWLDTPESRAPFALKKGGIGHVNLIYEPVKIFSTGIEYMYGGERTTNDALGYANRVQMMVKLNF